MPTAFLNKPCFGASRPRTDNRLHLVNPWGVSFANGESHPDFEPGHKYGPALSGDG